MNGWQIGGSMKANHHWQSGGLSSRYGIQNGYDTNYNLWQYSSWVGRLPLAKSTENGFASGYNCSFTLPIGGKITCKTTKGKECTFSNSFRLSVKSNYTYYSRNNSLIYMQEDNTPFVSIYGNTTGNSSDGVGWYHIWTYMSSLTNVTDTTHFWLDIPADTKEATIHCESYFGNSSTKEDNLHICNYDLIVSTDSEGLTINQKNLVIQNDSLTFYEYSTKTNPYFTEKKLTLYDGGQAYYGIDTSDKTTSDEQCQGFLNEAFALNIDNPTGYKSFYLANGINICTTPSILYRDGIIAQK